jgi:hypothetical protein
VRLSHSALSSGLEQAQSRACQTPSLQSKIPPPQTPLGMLTSEVTTCTQGLQAQRRDQKRWALWCIHAVASAFAAASAPLSCAAGVKQVDERRRAKERGGGVGRERVGGGEKDWRGEEGRSARELCELAAQVRYRGDVACAMHIEWWCSWQGGEEEQQTHLTSELTHAATLQKGKGETSSTPVLEY